MVDRGLLHILVGVMELIFGQDRSLHIQIIRQRLRQQYALQGVKVKPEHREFKVYREKKENREYKVQRETLEPPEKPLISI